MKILLTSLNSKYIHTALALKYLYITSMELCPGLRLFEYTINQEESHVFTEILQEDYDVVAFSCYIWNIERTLSLAERLKKASPKLVIVLGGPEVSYDSRTILENNSYIDIIVKGEGEFSFRCLCQAFSESGPQLSFDELKDLPGLTYRALDSIVENPLPEVLKFESIPFPYDYFPCEKDQVIYYESARGCPYRCSYCLSSVDKDLRFLPLDRVKEELSYFIYNRVRQVKLIDRSFNGNPGRCLDILKFIKEKDRGLTNFHFEICGENIDGQLLQFLSTVRKGLFRFEVGIQSTNRQTLRSVNRGDRVDLLMENLQRLIALDTVEVHVDLIAGLPFEDYQSFKNSFNQAYCLNAGTLQLGFLKLLKGTPLREMAESHGYVYHSKPPYEVISNNYMSALDLGRLKQVEELVDLYYNRGGFEETLRYLTTVVWNSPFDFFEDLSIFYRIKGFRDRSHKKEDLYRIINSFMEVKGRKQPELRAEVNYLLCEDMARALNPEVVKRFERKGWEIL